MRAIVPVNLSQIAPPEIGPKSVAIGLNFASAGADNKVNFDLNQEYNSGQLGPIQSLYMDLTNTQTYLYDIVVGFENSQQTMRFIRGAQSMLPFLGGKLGNAYAYNVSRQGFSAALNASATLYALNMLLPFFISPYNLGIQTLQNTIRSGVITVGGFSQTINIATIGAYRKIMIGNPIGAIEPLYFDFGQQATVNSYALAPGEKIQIAYDTYMGTSITVMAATTGHQFAMHIAGS